MLLYTVVALIVLFLLGFMGLALAPLGWWTFYIVLGIAIIWGSCYWFKASGRWDALKRTAPFRALDKKSEEFFRWYEENIGPRRGRR